MSLASNLLSLTSRIATEFKAIRTLISGTGTGNISGLTTADKTSLVAAINEVKASSAGAPPDATTTVKGIVELATDAEAIAADSTRAVTGSNVAAVFADRIDTNVALGSSNVKVPSQAAVKAYADGLIAANDAWVVKGVIDASTNPNYPAASAGHTYRISVAGKIGGASGVDVEAGDIILALVDGSAAGNQATVGANWTVIQSNITGAVTGPATSVNGNLASFSGTGGKIIADSGYAVDNDGALAANSSTRLPTQSAVRAYAQPLDTDLSALAALVSAANKVPYATGAGTWALADFTAAGRSVVGAADAAAQRAVLSVYSQSEVGDPNTDFVAAFNTALA